MDDDIARLIDEAQAAFMRALDHNNRLQDELLNLEEILNQLAEIRKRP